MDGKSPLIDIVVPVYGVEKYLEKCVDSLLRQEFEDYGVILVDDGSPDGCPAICDGYAARFPERVRVIHKENGGLSDARNTGARASDAELIAFVDSDDHVSGRYLPSLYEAMTRLGAQMAVSPVYKEYPAGGGETRLTAPPEMPETALTRDKALEELCYETYFSGYSCGKLLRRETVLAHPFPAGRYYEDSFTVYRWFMDCGTIAYTPEKAYFYFQTPNSIQRRAFEPRHMDLVYAVSEMAQLLARNGEVQSVTDAAACKLFRSCYVTAFHAADMDRQSFLRAYERIKPLWRGAYPAAKRTGRLSGKDRLLFSLALGSPGGFRALVRAFQKLSG